MSTPRLTLTEALAAWDRRAAERQLERADVQRRHVLDRFPLAAWPTLDRDRYGLGGGQETFCYLMEFGTPDLGGIGGGSARKHLIYRRSSDGSWYHDRRFGSLDEAWERIRAAFVRVLDLAAAGDLAAIEGVAPTNWAPSLVGKSVFTYFPDRVLSIYSHAPQQHFWELLGGQGEVAWSASGAAQLLTQARTHPGLAELSPAEIGLFLYWWADPRASRRVVKIAPGENAKFWDECREGGYICIGWDEVPNLSEFEQKDEFRARFRETYKHLYGSEAKLSAKANEVWTLRELEPGDLVVANKGTSQVLGVGTVVEPGYEWRPDRSEFQHTVRVRWDESYRQLLDPPFKSWGTVTVAQVPNTVFARIEGGRGKNPDPPKNPIDTQPPILPRPAGEKIFEEIEAALDRKGQIILYGPPGTGKTYTANGFCSWFYWGVDTTSTDGQPESVPLVTRVTFHPSYTYEDFVEGYRPIDSGSDSLVLRLKDGIFKRVCRTAARYPDRTYVLLIDEINRGNIPRIFGELITLLEMDKRGMVVTLPQSGQPFAVPKNVRIIGTMNTADRSIKLLDAAMRRRFSFIELMPEPGLLAGAEIGGLALDEFLEALNQRIAKREGREKQIGHSYLLDGSGQSVTSPDEFARRFRLEILPLLQEYSYEDYPELEYYLGKGIVNASEFRLKTDVLHNPDQLLAALRESFMPAGPVAEDAPDQS